ncbi:MAG: sigma-70 family RNA polymerase sigma factor [Phycisphaeraceae bacterium]|nr:sigma-70 family RNA polymerase sigma factor [Phycisphaeraceae bacterium]
MTNTPDGTDWPRILQAHGPMVWRTVCRLTPSRQDAEDCYQETFLAACKTARRQEIQHWAGFLKRVATARALDRLRQRLRQPQHRAAGLDADPPDRGRNDPPRQAQAQELGQRLRDALSQLSSQQAEVFCLRFLEQMTYQEIAQTTGLEASHVGVLLHRARQQLQTLLDPPASLSRRGEREVCRE